MMIDNFTIHALAEAELTLNRIKSVYNIEEQVEQEKNKILKEKAREIKELATESEETSFLPQNYTDSLKQQMIGRRNL